MENSEKNVEKKRKSVGKSVGRVLLVLLLVCAALLLIFHKAVGMTWNNLTQKKNEMDTSAEWDGGQSWTKVPYSEVSEADYVDIYVPANVQNPPLLVMVHGGGFVMGDSQTRQSQLVYRYFRDHGYAVASVNYRLADEAGFPAPVEDVKACVRFLRANADKYGFNADRIAIAGESAGGYLATMAAVTNDDEFNSVPYIGEDMTRGQVSAEVQVLVDYYGCVELGNMEQDWKTEGIPNLVIKIANYWASDDLMGGYENFESFFLRQNMSELTEEQAATYMPAYYIDENWDIFSDKHVNIVHGDSDLTVPILQSERLNEHLQQVLGADGVTYEVVEKAGHAGEPIFSEEELAKVDNYLQQYLYDLH